MTLAAALSAATGRRVAARPERAVGGGSINECWRWSSREGPLFVKLAPGDRLWMFEAEAEGLDELGRANALRVPQVLGHGAAAGQAFLALEWIDFGSASSRSEIAARRRARGTAPRDRRAVRLASRQHDRQHATTQRS